MEFNPKSNAIQKAKAGNETLLLDQSTVLAIGNRLTLACMSLTPALQRTSVGNFTTQAEALNCCQVKKPSLLIATESLEQGDGIDLAREVKKLSRDTKVLLFLERETQKVTRDAINAHADSVVFTSTIGLGVAGDFVQALVALSKGDTYYPASVRERAGFDLKPLPDMSVKELETLRALCSGLSNKEIAESLVVSTETVKTHVSNLISKFGVKDRTAVVIAAIRSGL